MKLVASILSIAVLAWPAGALEIDSAIDLDPKLEQPRIVRVFSPRLKPLWLQALSRPEVDLKRRAADAIAAAHTRGMAGLSDAIPLLMETLDLPDQHPVVKFAAARALIVLDSRQAAPMLRKHAKEGLEMAQLIEPVLARWNDAPMREVWLRRLADDQVAPREWLLAVDGLREVGEQTAVGQLRALATGRQVAADLRLQAARAVGTLQSVGLEEEAQRLASDKSREKLIDRLVSALLLAQHRGSQAEQVLLDLAADPEPAVAAIALRRLREIGAQRVSLTMLRELGGNPDSGLRNLAARLLEDYRTSEATLLLAPLLDDEVPENRRSVADGLVALAAVAEMDGPVRQGTLQMLATNLPRALEQAAMVLGTLRHEPAGPRLAQLLNHENAKVNIAAAWALRRLAAPATGAALFQRALDRTEQTAALQQSQMAGPSSKTADSPAPLRQVYLSEEELEQLYRQMEQLLQSLGTVKYREADALLRRFFPKPPPASSSVEVVTKERLRASALWSLGLVYADQPEPSLVNELVRRLDDTGPDVPEAGIVRCVAAVSLGRMKAQTALPALRRWQESADAAPMLANACTWAIHTIQGTPIPPLDPGIRSVDEIGWFLEPLAD